jgi:hypothetical protein
MVELNIFAVGYPHDAEFLLQPNYVVVANFDVEATQAVVPTQALRELVSRSIKNLIS